MRIKEITSGSNDVIKRIKKLQTKAKTRYEEKVYIVEGFKQIRELAPQRIQLLIVSDKEKLKQLTIEDRTEIIVVPDKIFQEITQDPSPQGVLAVVLMKQSIFDIDRIKADGLYLMLDGLQDPGNLGTILRVADAVGIDGIFLSKTSVDLYNSKVVKSTMGSLEHVDVFVVEHLPTLIEQLRQKKILIYGAYLEESISHFEADFNLGCCVVIGNEGNGISDEVIQCVNQRIKIPMPGKSESLNASVATSVILYEALRQRTHIKNIDN